MAELVYPLRVPVVSSLPSASSFANRCVSFNNRLYYSDGTQWIKLDQDADTVDGFHASAGQVSGSWHSRIPVVSPAGVIELGKFIDFHQSGTDTSDFAPRLEAISNRNLSILTTHGRYKRLAGVTTTAYTIYVDNVNGNDTTGTGSSSAPYATIGRALEEVGEFINNYVVIILKASPNSYGTLDLSGFVTYGNTWATLIIRGEMTTQVSGTISSFSNSVNDPVYGSSVQVARITDTTKNWATNEHQYKILKISKGGTVYYRVITYNDATNLYCGKTFPVTLDNTWSYEILTWGTKVNDIQMGFNVAPFSFEDLEISGSNVQPCIRGFANFHRCRFLTNSHNRVYVVCQGSRNVFYDCVIDNRNNSNVALVVSPWHWLNAHFVIFDGTVILHNDNTGNAAVWLDHGQYRVTLYNGTRILKPGGNTNTAGIAAQGNNTIIFDASFGKPVIDVRGTGIWSDGFTYFLNDTVPYVSGTLVNFNVATRSFAARHRIALAPTGIGNTADIDNIHSTLRVYGSLATQVTPVSANTTLNETHHTVFVDASGGDRTITLPSASACTGRQYIIKKSDGSANVVVITAQTGQVIETTRTYMLRSQNEFVTLISDGANWRIAGHNRNVLTSSITIYVDNTSGNDTTGTGSSSAPFATVWRALQEVGQFYNGNVTIILKASATAYGPITLAGLSRTVTNAVFTIQGETTVVASGTVTGFSNSVNDPVYGANAPVARITDTTKNWTTNQHRHRLLRVYKGGTSYLRIITNNDATNLYCSFTFPVTIDNTWSYEILDWGTKVSGFAGFELRGHFRLSYLDIDTTSSNFTGINIKDSGYYGFEVLGCRVRISSTQIGPAIESVKSHIAIHYSVIDGNNNTSIAGGLFRFMSTGGSAWIQGTIFDNCSTAAISSYPDFATVNFYDGCRIYKGTTNPAHGVYWLCGLFNTWAGYGTCVIDAGANGITMEGGGAVRGITTLYFGPNVTNRTAGIPGFVNDNLLATGVGVNVPNFVNLHSRLQVAGSVATQVTTVSANTTLSDSHHIVLVNASGGTITITLPNATTCGGRQYIIKKIDSSVNAVIIAAQSGQTIDGQSSQTLSTQWQFMGVASDGSNWFRIE